MGIYQKPCWCCKGSEGIKISW